ncbi:MAG: RNA methyltransferase [Chlamydiae bacterium]|nr:RNA methyltransferase [Chlamydiota bacterium]
MLEITSAQNPTFKHLMKLVDKRDRDQSKVFLIEGYREVLRAYEGNIEGKTLYICPQFFLGENEKELIQAYEKKNVPIVKLAKPLFEKLSFRDRPDGMLLLAKQFDTSFEKMKLFLKDKKNPFILVAESIEKPGNLGSILRSCDAAKVDCVIVCDRCTDIYNPNVVRSSVGTLFTVPIFELTSKEAIEFLKDQKIQIAAGTPHTNCIYTEENFNQPVAIAVGTEQLGLSKEWMEKADIKVKIPMLGKADSLNVANATTLLLYEVVRQRMKK